MPTLADLNQLSNLDTMRWIDLRTLREKYKNDPWMQSLIAPFEHRAYARESVSGNPLTAAAFGLAVPAYQLRKLADLRKDETPASWDQLFAGYQGIGEGMRK